MPDIWPQPARRYLAGIAAAGCAVLVRPSDGGSVGDANVIYTLFAAPILVNQSQGGVVKQDNVCPLLPTYKYGDKKCPKYPNQASSVGMS